jgi:thiamine transport system substrate-binding protein
VAFGGDQMKNFLIFVAVVFGLLFSLVFFKQNRENEINQLPVLKIYGSSSFISQWGPGPWLKETFEKTCNCRVEFYDGADSTILLQRLKAESKSQGADLVLGIDQYDLEMYQTGIEWKELSSDGFEFDPMIKNQISKGNFLPYNWGVMAFVFRKSQLNNLPRKLDDLLMPELKEQIALQDPRMSSPGLQFLLWVISVKGEDEGFQFLKKLNSNVHSYSNSWSKSYGLFTKNQTKTAFSYTTSPIYHLVEEKSTDYLAAEFTEGHPVQFEFVGIPGQCRNCDLARKFVELIFSSDGQTVIMEKNYMFPAIRGVRGNSPFAQVPVYKTLENSSIPTLKERERLLKKWTAIRRED